MHCIVLHIGIYLYWTNSNKTTRSHVFAFNIQTTTKHSTRKIQTYWNAFDTNVPTSRQIASLSVKQFRKIRKYVHFTTNA